ncbi:MAG: hypothetical protein E7119_03865 [Bacteroidales bacterium]|nr:hypothetical protein [Bacteroidales bacterium]
MGATEIKGKSVTINVPAYALYQAFADMRNFVHNLPPEKKESIVATEDTIEGDVQGMRMGAAIASRVPFSYIKLKEHGQTPIQFEVGLFFNALDVQRTEFHMEAKAELPFMIKMMIGNRLQEVIDKVTDQLALAAEGKVKPEDFNMENFTSNMANNS